MNIFSNIMTAHKPLRKADRYIWGFYIFIIVISVIEQYSASSSSITPGDIFHPISSHVIHLLLGLIITYISSIIFYGYYTSISFLLAGLGIVSAFFLFKSGSVVNGAQRGFSLFGINVQPSEIIKLSCALLVATICAFYQEKGRNMVSTKGIICSALVIISGCALLINDGLSNTILTAVISLTVLFLSGIPFKKFMIAVFAIILVAIMAMFVKQVFFKSTDRTDTWSSRVATFLKPDTVAPWDRKTDDSNLQEIYAHIAQANGGLTGVMPGNTRENVRLPFADRDYIYAIVIEDFGLIGGIFLLAIYLCFLLRAFILARKCTTVYAQLLLFACAFTITYQALYHIMIVTGVIPVSGQQLPFLSSGGSSIIFMSLAVGIMLSVSQYEVYKDDSSKKKKNKKKTSVTLEPQPQSEDNKFDLEPLE